MKTYYAIISKSGKSRDITAITDNKKRAENIKNLYNNATNSVHYIEEVYEGGEIDEMFFFVCAFLDGQIHVIPQAFCLSEKWIDKIHESDDDAIKYSIDVFARDKEHAIQKAKDLWEKYKSNKEATDGNL